MVRAAVRRLAVLIIEVLLRMVKWVVDIEKSKESLRVALDGHHFPSSRSTALMKSSNGFVPYLVGT
jgi:hypothetical protein